MTQDEITQGNVDQREKLAEEPFDYQVMKNGSIFLYWNSKHIKTLKGEAAQKLLAKLEGADSKTVQLLLAKATGNFKHGNERK